MCLCTLCAERFLQGLYGSGAFRGYCRGRRIPPPQRPWDETVRRWIDAVAGLPAERRAQVEWEQLAVCELGTPEGCDHLLDAAGAAGAPPATVSHGTPLALWFLLHRPALFRTVYLHHERREADVWHAGRVAAGLPLSDLRSMEEGLAAGLGTFFRESIGAGAACTVSAHRIPEGVYFCVRLAGRPHHVEAISPAGTPKFRHVARPLRADVAYYPRDGTVLVRSPLRSPARVRQLLDCVGRTGLSAAIRTEMPGFSLDRLKHPFRPLPDAGDVEAVRVKALHLRYPGRSGRRELRLETLTSDRPSAVDELVRAHAGEALDELHVAHAVLQLRLRVEGCSKTHVVRLWPDRCDAGEGPLRTRVLACLRTWGL